MAYILIIITSLVSFLAFQQRSLFDKLQLNAFKTYNHKEYYRLLTHGFVHADWMHLFFNMFVLFFFGPTVESMFVSVFPLGRLMFVSFYLLAVVIASIFSVLKHKNNRYYNSVGASGAVSSILFAFILFTPLDKICLWGIICLPGFVWGVVYLFYTHYQSQHSQDNINHDAHFAGAIFGFIFPLILSPSLLLNFFNTLLSMFS
jgi:membrane associated rhomboid family serine protease